jgi:glutamate 5-kinase
VHGEFKANETISILDLNNKVIAKGVTGYSSTDLGKIKGKRTSEIEKILNRKSHDEVIHRDNLVLIGETSC